MGINVKIGLDSLKSYRIVHKNIYLFSIFSILLFSILNISVLSKDTIQPVIDFFDARPYIQIENGYVNITCITQDNENIKTVNLTILFPNNTSKTEKMLLSPMVKYVYNAEYNILGNHRIHIIVEDETGNIAYTPIKNFWITSDKNDMDSDGMPDFWEKKYNLDPEDSNNAVIDSDSDGYSNQKEYQIGTNPIKDIFLQNAIYRVKNNSGYVALSIILFILLVLFSLNGIGRRFI